MKRLSRLESDILNIIQKDFPISHRPYQVLADRTGSTEDEAYEAVQSLREAGIIRRIGAVFDLRKLGYTSTLTAMRVPPDRLESVSEIVNRHPGVTHNYCRDDAYNLWFTLIGESQENIEVTLNKIRDDSGVSDLLTLPATNLFKIDTNFGVSSDEEEWDG